MPDSPDVYGDPEFHQLPLAEKHKVLMATDEDYRGLPPSEQAKALDHVHYDPQYGPNPNDKPAAQAPKPVPNARIRNLPNPAEGMSLGRAALSGIGTGLTAATLPEMAMNPMATARGVAGGAVGGYAGGHVGEYLGGETGKGIGTAVGGLAGGWRGAKGLSLGGRFGRLVDEIFGSEAGAAAGAKGGEAATPAKTGRLSDEIIKIPEPRGAPTTPNLNNSIPREELPGLAQQGRQGAGEQLRATGKTVVYTPEGGYAPPKSKSTLSEIMSKGEEGKGLTGGQRGDKLVTEMDNKSLPAGDTGPKVADHQAHGRSWEIYKGADDRYWYTTKGGRLWSKPAKSVEDAKNAINGLDRWGATKMGTATTKSLWQVGFEGDLKAAREAAKELGVDPSKVEQVDDGVYNMPLPAKLQQKMRRSGSFEHTLSNGKSIYAEMP